LHGRFQIPIVDVKYACPPFAGILRCGQELIRRVGRFNMDLSGGGVAPRERSENGEGEG
jgi:hypothetical protein